MNDMKTTDFDKNLVVDTDISEKDIIWFDVKNEPFALSGVFYDESRGQYLRMPQEIADRVNDGVSWLNTNTAGGRVRFITDSSFIGIRAVMENCPLMPHITLAGQSGFDLYRKTERGELYERTFMPPMGMKTGYSSGQVFDGERYEYTINFPLYDGVKELYVALKKDAFLSAPGKYAYEKPVVYYGSSITQGGCASRPGNSYQAMISRMLDTEYINLGFSGSCRAEDVMADYINGLDMSVFVLDYDHNTPSVEYLEQTHGKFFRAIREKHPELPIVILSAPDSLLRGGDFMKRRDIVKATFDAAIAAGDENVAFVDGLTLFEGELFDSCTVDGCHPNDLGFYRMAQKTGAAVKAALIKRYGEKK